MKPNKIKSRISLGVGLFAILVSGVFALSLSASANETDSTGENTGAKKPLWLEAKDRAEKNKALVEERTKERAEMKEERAEARQDAFCTRLSERSERVQSRIAERAMKVTERKTKRADAFEEKRAERDAALDSRREERDAKRAEMYAKLLERAGSDAEKQAAVATFKTAVEKAVADRKAAIDAAIAAFRAGVDAAVAGKKTSIESGVASYESAVKSAFDTAIGDCQSGKDPESVRSTLDAALQSARDGVKDERASAQTVGEQVKKLAETKRAAFQMALSTFKTTVESARTDLKKAFASGSGEMEEDE